ncbi:unnamed protein product [Closterium sp. Naga37s-1]|nr:unnamed protein product [Closterium sp. Naga37s-1]
MALPAAAHSLFPARRNGFSSSRPRFPARRLLSPSHSSSLSPPFPHPKLSLFPPAHSLPPLHSLLSCSLPFPLLTPSILTPFRATSPFPRVPAPPSPPSPAPLFAPHSAPLPVPGQELAQRFAAMGARLILSARSAERLQAVGASCCGTHAPEGVVVLPFDLKGGADVLHDAVRQAESVLRGEEARGEEGPCGAKFPSPPPRPPSPPTLPRLSSLFPPFPLAMLEVNVARCSPRQVDHPLSLPLPLLPPFPLSLSASYIRSLPSPHQGMFDVNEVATIRLMCYTSPCSLPLSVPLLLLPASSPPPPLPFPPIRAC